MERQITDAPLPLSCSLTPQSVNVVQNDFHSYFSCALCRNILERKRSAWMRRFRPLHCRQQHHSDVTENPGRNQRNSQNARTALDSANSAHSANRSPLATPRERVGGTSESCFWRPWRWRSDLGVVTRLRPRGFGHRMRRGQAHYRQRTSSTRVRGSGIQPHSPAAFSSFFSRTTTR
jgi:hypothetical protein